MEQQDSAGGREEAERLLKIATKLLHSRDLTGAREFAILAQESYPLIDSADQILAVSDVLLAAENRISGDRSDHYAVLQLDRHASNGEEMVRKQYRRLALQLHPDKSGAPFADVAFKHVSDAWAVLSDKAKRERYDREVGMVFEKVDLNSPRNITSDYQNYKDQNNQHQKLQVRRGDESSKLSTFWTACPYCYNLYEYPIIYEDCCLRCQNCQKAFHGVVMPSLPPFAPGREAYYCTWNLFPLNSAISSADTEKKANFTINTNNTPSAPSWNPSSFPTAVPVSMNGSGGTKAYMTTPLSGKKRGRPRKYPLP